LSKAFYQKTEDACKDRALSDKLNSALETQIKGRLRVCEELGDVDAFKKLGADVRDDVLLGLDKYLLEFVKKITASGVNVHWAEDASEARQIISDIAKQRNVKTIVKSKSMITEEIELNTALENLDIEVTETDLGEFIIQIAGQKPSHIVLPAIHLSRREVADIFADKIDYTGSDDPKVLTKAAREYLRDKFKEAQMGISGVNFAIAEQGLWATCTNEGNARYAMTWPDIYVGVMGIERIVQDTDSAAVMLKLLARFATGQRITQYTNFAKGPCKEDGPKEVHLVLLDNGRSKILGTKYWKMLRCIRCGACLNVCPVFRYVGGQNFPGSYSGPMGTVLLPLLNGFDKANQELPNACSVCGRCSEICPVKIPLHDLILDLKHDRSKTKYRDRLMKLGMWAVSLVMRHPAIYKLGQKFAKPALMLFSREGWVKWLPSIPGKWTKFKDLPLPANKTFISKFKNKQ
jgi:L-lactate dehydrogenase complex protein LldF